MYKYQSGKRSPAFEFSSNKYAINWFDLKNVIVTYQNGIWLFDVISMRKGQIYENKNLNTFDFYSLFLDRKYLYRSFIPSLLAEAEEGIPKVDN